MELVCTPLARYTARYTTNPSSLGSLGKVQSHARVLMLAQVVRKGEGWFRSVSQWIVAYTWRRYTC